MSGSGYTARATTSTRNEALQRNRSTEVLLHVSCLAIIMLVNLTHRSTANSRRAAWLLKTRRSHHSATQLA